MKALRNENGIALVTSLMLTLISLAIILALLYMITAGTKLSGMQKRYATALDASYGGAEIVAKDIIPFVFKDIASPNLIGDLTSTYNVSGNSLNLNLSITQACFQAKLTKDISQWPAGCDAMALPVSGPDLTMQLPSNNGQSPYTIYSKIVSTRVGNSDTSGLNLTGAGVAEANNIVYPQSQPFLYKIEIQGQKQGDASVSANLEVLYAY
ncbi:MAG: hypothetical protein ABSG48_00555 [Geobacteraceae bacterium]|jgi:hypothetical protein